MKLIALASLLAFSYGAAAAAPLELKGIPLGASEPQLIAKYAGLKCGPPTVEGADRICTLAPSGGELSTLAERPVASWKFFISNRDGLTMAMAVVPRAGGAFGPVFHALEAKYGRPMLQDTDYMEKGTSYKETVFSWHQGSRLLLLQDKGHEPSFNVLYSDSRLGKSDAAQKGKKAAKDL